MRVPVEKSVNMSTALPKTQILIVILVQVSEAMNSK